MQEIHSDIEEFRKSGKPVYAYLKSPGTREYYIATAASRVYMEPVDDSNLKGLGLELMYFRNTLDKLGVQVDVEHAGKYKDYGDMFTKTGMSPETREVMNSIADDIYGDLVNTIAKGRGKSADVIRATIDDGPFLSIQAKEKGLVDELRYEDEMFGELKTALHESDLKKVAGRDFVNVPDAAAASPDRIAFVVGEGSITRGDPDSTDDSGLESEQFDRILAKVENDSGIKAVIVRIDSPGGEVTASDEMWRAMNELRKKKPVVISMSDAAASGGYYMAMSGDPIIAYPATETGSIGVVFGKPNLHGLYDKLGITKDYVSRGRFALIDSDYQSLSDAGRAEAPRGHRCRLQRLRRQGRGGAQKEAVRDRTCGSGTRLAGRSGKSEWTGGRTRRSGQRGRTGAAESRHCRERESASGTLSGQAQHLRHALQILVGFRSGRADVAGRDWSR